MRYGSKMNTIIRSVVRALFILLLIGDNVEFGVAQAATASQEGEESVSQSIQASILIVPPREHAVYTLYGHAALRIRIDQGEKISDLVYNYGVFDFDAPHFIAKFVSGRTDDYRVASCYTPYYIQDYVGYGCDVYELVLNLTPIEASHLQAILEENIKPENAYYHYNFIYDNCATRLVDILESVIEGEIQYPDENAGFPQRSPREMIDECSDKRPWLRLGTDLALGVPADEKVSVRHQLFLPLNLMTIFRACRIENEEGVSRELVVKENTYMPEHKLPPHYATPVLLHPGALGCVLMLAALFFFFVDRKGERKYLIVYIIFFASLGVLSLILYFLSFISLHPLTYPNLNLIALHPLHLLLGVPLLIWKPYSKSSYYYHFVNLLLQLVYMVMIFFTSLQSPNFSIISWSLAATILSFHQILLYSYKKLSNYEKS